MHQPLVYIRALGARWELRQAEEAWNAIKAETAVEALRLAQERFPRSMVVVLGTEGEKADGAASA